MQPDGETDGDHAGDAGLQQSDTILDSLFLIHRSIAMSSSIDDDYYNLPLMSTLLSCILTNRELKGKLLVILTVILLQLLYVFSYQSPCKYKLTIITMKIITPQYLTYPDVM